VGSADLYRYRVERAPAPGGLFAPVGVTGDPGFIDTGVEAGTAYSYVVVAEDTSYNRSSPSAPLAVTAADRDVAVTFRVTVPDDTPASDTVYLAGDFQGWDPGATPMTSVDATTWEITVSFGDGSSPQYKYTRGTWEAVEQDAGCGEIPNRQLVVDFGAGGEQMISDTVEKWRDLDACR
jgi:pullulanase